MADQHGGHCTPKRDSQKEPNVIGFAPSSTEVAENIRTLAKHSGRSEQEIVQWLLDTSPARVPLEQQGGLGRALASVIPDTER